MLHLKKLKIVFQYPNNFIFLFLLVVIITIVRIKIDDYHTKYSSQTEVITGVVTSIKKSNEKTVLSVRNNETILVTQNGYQDYHLGETIMVTGTIKKPSKTTVFHLFQYNQYLKSKRIYWQMYANKIEVKKQQQSFYYWIQEQFIMHMNKYQSKKYLYAFILGDSSKIDETTKEQFQSLGISHLFAISGMHVSLLSLFLSKLLSKICSKKMTKLLLTLFFIYYILLTNLAPSIIRAVTLTVVFLWTKRYHRIQILVILCSILLLYNPFYCYNLGFLFSFIISFFLLKFQNIIQMRKGYIWQLWSTSCIAFLASFPILIANFYEVNFLTVFYNLLFVPFVSYLLFPLSLITFCLPIFDSLFQFLIVIFEAFVSVMMNFTWKVTFCHVSIIFLIIYYIVIYYLLSMWRRKKWLGISLLLLLLFLHQLLPYTKDTKITILDVGQGDSIVIQSKQNQSSILIDTGGMMPFSQKTDPLFAKNRIIPYLKSQGIKKIDALVLTHGDYDHMGEAINLVNNFTVEKVIFNCGEFNELEQELIKVLNDKKIPYYFCIKELNIDNNKLYFLNSKEYGNENDNSSVIYLNYNHYKFLFMGDAGVEVEEDLIEKYNLEDIDVLKVGHHGSKTSSGKDFIDEINPKYSIISVSKNNRYGHPNKEVLENLNNSKLYRTDQDGSVMFEIKNNKFKIETCSP